MPALLASIFIDVIVGLLKTSTVIGTLLYWRLCFEAGFILGTEE